MAANIAMHTGTGKGENMLTFLRNFPHGGMATASGVRAVCVECERPILTLPSGLRGHPYKA